MMNNDFIEKGMNGGICNSTHHIRYGYYRDSLFFV